MVFELFQWVVCLFLLHFVYEFFRRRPMLKDFSDKYVVVTGCDSGFGRALTQQLDRLGCHVLAACYGRAAVKELRSQCSPRVHPFLLDVADGGSVREALKFVESLLPPGQGLWALVNNAGIGFSSLLPFEFQSRDDYQKVLDVNLLGVIDVTLTFLPLIKASRGRIVNMASAAGRSSSPVNTPYPVSKWGVETFTDGLRMHCKLYGVKVSLIEPGFFATPILDADRIQHQAEQDYMRLDEQQRDRLGANYVQGTVRVFSQFTKRRASPKIHQVVDAYIHGIFGCHPKKRYCVGWDNFLLLQPLSYMPSFISDAFQIYMYKKMKPKKR